MRKSQWKFDLAGPRGGSIGFGQLGRGEPKTVVEAVEMLLAQLKKSSLKQLEHVVAVRVSKSGESE